MSKDEQPLCPVDHNAREAWLRKGGNSSDSSPKSDQPSCPVDHSARNEWLSKVSISAVNVPEAIESTTNETPATSGCTSDSISSTPGSESSVNLPTDREISSIPRTSSGSNWIYPSQKQFFDAMKRKSSDPEARDMQTVVPIHNAVNERAWSHILMWEGSNNEEAIQKCGGITLTSFKGDLKKLTPRAWINSTFWGYQKPFDRHDWVIDRCGTSVEYVIDFYSGGGEGASFYLDVRPKVNTWEGVKLRLERAIGFK